MKIQEDFVESLKALRSLEQRNKELDVEYIDMLIRLMKNKVQKEYKTILDAPCRTALMHEFLKQKGYDVYGVECRKHIAEKLMMEDNDHYFYQDLRKLNLGMKFDVILNFYTALGMYSEDDDLSILKSFYDHLNENGVLILETRHANRLSLGYKIKTVNDIVIVISEEMTSHNKVNFVSRAYKKVNDDLYFLARVENEIRLYTIEELIEMLKKVGFKIEYIFDNLSIVPVMGNDIKSDRVVIVARR